MKGVGKKILSRNYGVIEGYIVKVSFMVVSYFTSFLFVVVVGF